MCEGRFGARKTACAAFCGYFLSNKSAPAKRKKGFYARRLPKNEEIKGIFGRNTKEL